MKYAWFGCLAGIQVVLLVVLEATIAVCCIESLSGTKIPFTRNRLIAAVVLVVLVHVNPFRVCRYIMTAGD